MIIRILRKSILGIYSFLCVAVILYLLIGYYYSYNTTALAFLPLLSHGIFELMVIGIPYAFLVATILLFISWKINDVFGFALFVVLILGIPFLKRTFGYHLVQNKPSFSRKFKVLNFNVMGFNTDDNGYSDFGKTIGKTKYKGKALLWIKRQKADVVCLQEIFHNTTLPNQPYFNSLDSLTKHYPYYKLLYPERINTKQLDGFSGNLGLGIFSKHPILNSAFVPLFEGSPNGTVWADIKLDEDTIRVINVQFFSMGIRVGTLKNGTLKRQKQTLNLILKKLQLGYTSHKNQAEYLNGLIENTPHSVVLMGDFNQVPYGRIYTELSKNLENAFENAGIGLGFSYNQPPKNIRIDNIFFSGYSLVAHEFKTHSEINYSDHYPLSCTFYFKE